SRVDRINQVAAWVSAMGEIRGLHLLTEILETNPLFDEAGMETFLTVWEDDFTRPEAVMKVALYQRLVRGPEEAYAYMRKKWEANPGLLEHPDFVRDAVE